MVPPYRQPALRTLQAPAPPPALAVHDVEPASEAPSTMWVCDSDGGAHEEREGRSRFATRMGYAVLVVLISCLFVLLVR